MTPRIGTRQQVKALKDKANLLIAQVSHPVLAQFARFHTTDTVSTTGWLVEQTDHVHQRTLTRTAGTNNGDIFAFFDGQADPTQCVHLSLAHFIGLGQLGDCDDRWFGGTARAISIHYHAPALG